MPTTILSDSKIKKDVSISICVPAFNEEGTLKDAAEDLRSTLLSRVKKLEIIIVNDGSTDSTRQIAQKLSNQYPEIKVITHKINVGVGACYRDALAIACGDYFTWFPADHENSADELVQCLLHLGNGCVVTCHHRRHDPRSKLRQMLSYLYTWILNKHFNLNLNYYNGLTVIPTKVLQSACLRAKGFAFSAESIIFAVKAGYGVVELAVPLRMRVSGKSKVFAINSILRTVKDLLRILSKN